MHVISQGFLWRLKWINLGVDDLFRGFKAPRKLLLMLFDGKRINKLTREDCKTGCKTLSKIETLYLELKLKETKFNRSLWSLKSKKKRTSHFFAR